MSSVIQSAIANSRQIYLLVDIQFGGVNKRISTKNISVPVSETSRTASGQMEWDTGMDWDTGMSWDTDSDTVGAISEYFFDGIILNQLTIAKTFDIRTFRYSTSDVQILISNHDRFQDFETKYRVEGSVGKVYVWSPGLTWAQISTDGLIFEGVFQKNWHTNFQYSFSLIERSRNKVLSIPKLQINTDTWYRHKQTDDGMGSVSGLPVPVIFGETTGGQLLYMVNTLADLSHDPTYAIAEGGNKIASSDFSSSGTKNVWNADGTVVATSYISYSESVDGLGNPVSQIAYTTGGVAAYGSSNQPMTCSFAGKVDGSGEYTGTANTLIEHPADITKFLLDKNSIDGVDITENVTFGTMKSILKSGWKFTTTVNVFANVLDVVDRLLYQCQAALVTRIGGKLGVMTLNTDGVSIGRIDLDKEAIASDIPISRTPYDMVYNNINVNYQYNPTSEKFEKSAPVYGPNSTVEKIKQSRGEYGIQPEFQLNCTDIGQAYTAVYSAKRFMDIFAFRHDTFTIDLPYRVVWDMVEGDVIEVTYTGGSSKDGSGWVDERCILLSRSFHSDRITTTWWRISTE